MGWEDELEKRLITTDRQIDIQIDKSSQKGQLVKPPPPSPPYHHSLKTPSIHRRIPQSRHPIHRAPLRRRRKRPAPGHEPEDPLVAHDALEHLRHARLQRVHQLVRRRRRHLVRDGAGPVLEQLQEGDALGAPQVVAVGGADEEGQEGDVDGEGFVGVGDVGGGEGGGGG